MEHKFSRPFKLIIIIFAILILIVGAVFLLGQISCNGKGKGSPNDKKEGAVIKNVKGIFREKEVTPAGGVARMMTAPILLENGNLVFYGKKEQTGLAGELYRFTSTDGGENWTDEEMKWDTQEQGCPAQVDVYMDGSSFFANYILNENKITGEKWWILRNGELTELPRPDWAEDSLVYACKMLTGETLFLYGVYYDPEAVYEDFETGTEQKVFYKIYNYATGEALDVSFPEDCDCANFGMFVDTSDPADPKLLFDGFENGYTFFSMDIKGKIQTLQTDVEGPLYGIDREGNCYYTNNGSIIRIAKNGGLKEEVVENNGFLLEEVRSYLHDGMACLPNGDFIAALEDLAGSQMLLVKYYYDENAELTKTDSLTIWSINENDMVRSAAKRYEKEHPETEIQIIIGTNQGSYQSFADLERNLKVSLLTDDCPDLIILDGLDYGSMTEKGYFIDLSSAVDTSGLLNNIISPMYQEESLYVIPGVFSAPVLIGDDFDKRPIRDLSDLKKAILEREPRPSIPVDSNEYTMKLSEEERYGIGFKDIEEMAHFILLTSAPALIKDGELDDKALAEVFDFLVSVGKHYGMEDYPEWADRFHVGKGEPGKDIVDYLTGEAEYRWCGRAQYGWGELKTPAYFGLCRRDEYLEGTTGTLISFPGLCKNPYIPKCVMGIPANAKNQAQAAELMQLILSNDIQAKQNMEGNPVNQAALEERIVKHEESVEEAGYVGDMRAFYEELETPVISSTVTDQVELAIRRGIYDVITGEKTKKQALKSIKKDTYLMFEEKK